MSIPVLYLIDRKTPLQTIVDYLAITPVRVVVIVDASLSEIARQIADRVLLDRKLDGIVARYLQLAQETEDCPIAIIGDFQEPIFAVEETNEEN